MYIVNIHRYGQHGSLPAACPRCNFRRWSKTLSTSASPCKARSCGDCLDPVLHARFALEELRLSYHNPESTFHHFSLWYFDNMELRCNNLDIQQTNRSPYNGNGHEPFGLRASRWFVSTRIVCRGLVNDFGGVKRESGSAQSKFAPRFSAFHIQILVEVVQ